MTFESDARRPAHLIEWIRSLIEDIMASGFFNRHGLEGTRMTSAWCMRFLLSGLGGLLLSTGLRAAPREESFQPFLERFCASVAARVSAIPHPRVKRSASAAMTEEGGGFFMSRVAFPLRVIPSAPTEPGIDRSSVEMLTRGQFEQLELAGCGCDGDPLHVEVHPHGEHVEVEYTSDTECGRRMSFTRIAGRWMLVELSIQD